MGSIVQVRPNADYAANANSPYPSGSYSGVLSDNNDGSFVIMYGSAGSYVEVSMGDIGLAAGQRIAAVRSIVRTERYNNGGFSVNAHLLHTNGAGYQDGFTFTNQNGGGPATFWGAWFTQRPNGGEWTLADFNALRVRFEEYGGATTGAKPSEFYAEADVRTQPTVSITSPYTDQRVFPVQPTLTWNYNAQGDTVSAHRVKVFTNATVTGGGFDPEASAAVWDSGRVGGAANSKQSGAALTYGQTYWFYVKLATDFNGADWWSAWQGVRFIINSPSTTSAVTVTPASPITTTNRPTIGWTYADADGDAQEHYYVRVFPESAYSAAGFTPDTDAGAAWVSGTVANSAARSAQTGELSPGVNYKAWVWTTDAGSGTRWSTSAVSSVFTITTAPGVVFDPPAVPEITSVSTDQDNQRTTVTFGGRDNMLTRNQASGDTGNIGWEPDSNLTAANLVRDTAQFLAGGASLKMTPTVNGTDMRARTTRNGTRGPFPVTAGRTYTALGSPRSTGTARSARVRVRWYDAAGVLISTSDGSTVVETSTGWPVQSVWTGQAPALATWAELVTEVLVPAEAHYWDNLSFAPGSSTVWTRGGLALQLGELADTFNRADSASSLGSADVGGAWSALVGTWGILTNRAYVSALANGTHGYAVLTSNYLADGFVEADITLSSVRAGAGVTFRALDANNNLIARLLRYGTTDTIDLFKRVGGTYTQLAAFTSAGLILGATYKLRVEFYGGQVYVKLNGVTKISYLMLSGELAQFGNYSKYGLYLLPDASPNTDDLGSRFDNFAAGLLPTQRVTLERSLDGGTTWKSVRGAVGADLGATQQTVLYDYEVPVGALARYRAITKASEAGNIVTSAYSAVMAQSVALTIDTWWLKDAVNPALNMKITVAPPFQFRRKESIQAFDPLGRKASVFVTDGARGIEGALNVWVKNEATYNKLQAILNNGRALLLQDPLGRSWWVKFADQDWDFQRAQPLPEEAPRQLRHFHALSLPFVEVEAPAVV